MVQSRVRVRSLLAIAGAVCAAIVSAPRAADAGLFRRTAAAVRTDLPIVSLAGTVDQAGLDNAMTACDPGCTLYLHRGAVVTGTLSVDSGQASGFILTGPLRGARPILQSPIAASSGGLQTESQTAVVTFAAGSPNAIRVKHVDIFGRKGSQPAPNPIDCLKDANETGVSPDSTCSFHPTRHRGILVDAGTDHVLEDFTVRDFIDTGVLVINSDDVEIARATTGAMGCHATDSSCGSAWDSVPGLGVVFGGGGVPPGLVRQSNGYGLQINQNSDRAHIHDGTLAYATKMGAELFGVPGGCAAANRSRDGVIERMTSVSSIVANNHCAPVIRDNAITGVRISGEEAISVASGITISGDSGGARVTGNVITDVQGDGISIGDSGDDIEIDRNVIVDACATQSIYCAGIGTSSSATGDDLRIFRNVIDVGNGGPTDGVGLFGASTGGRLALNRVTGGAGSTIAAALRIDAGVWDVRYQVLDFDTDASVAALDLNGGTVTLQADAFGDIEPGGHSVTTTRVSGTPAVDCASDLAGAGCYSEFSLAYVPDTQGLALSIEQSGNPDAGYLDEVIGWLLDARDAFQLERDVDSAAYPAEAHNIKFVAGVGDIVSTPTQTTALSAIAGVYGRLAHPDHTPVAIAHVQPGGNHDFNGSNTSAYRTAFPSSRYDVGRSIVTASTAAAVGSTSFDTADDLGIAQRLKPLTTWWQIISIPWELNGQMSAAWRAWAKARVDDDPDAFAMLVTHESLQDGAPNNDTCDLTESPDTQWLSLLNDVTHTNAGLGYRAWAATAHGHEVEASGFFCRIAQLNAAGDKVLRTAANWQQVNNFGAGGGDGWAVLLDFDALANTVRGRAFSPIANGGLGGYASAHDPGRVAPQTYDWTEPLDLTTRGGESSGGGGLDLGDLAVPLASRLPDFQPAKVAQANALAAEAWPKYDVTCATAPCASGHLPVPSSVQTTCGWPGNTPNPARGHTGGQFDTQRIDCVLDNLPNDSTAWVPDGDYEAGQSNPPVIVSFNGTRRQLECESNTGATFWGFTTNTNGGGCLLEGGASSTSANRVCGGLALGIGATNMWNPATEVAWTGGHLFGDTTITVSSAATLAVAPGDWVMLRMKDVGSEACEHIDELTGISPTVQEQDARFNHYAKVLEVNGNQLTIDRGLPMDYTATTCGSKYAQKVSPLSNAGVRNCRFALAGTDGVDVHPQAAIAMGGFNKDPAVGVGALAEGWLIGNRFEQYDEDIVLVRLAWRNLWAANIIDLSYGPEFNTDGLRTHYGTAQNEFVGNAFDRNRVASKQEAGGKLDIWAYNYCRGHTVAGIQQNCLFSHGRYNGPFLWEGNDATVNQLLADHWWGRNGPRITVYRNRNSKHDGGRYAGIVTSRDKCSTGTVGVSWVNPTTAPAPCTDDLTDDGGGDRLQWPIGDQINAIGNVADFLASSAIPASGAASMSGGVNDFDHLSTNMLFTRNRALQPTYGMQLFSPEPTTGCNGTCSVENTTALAPPPAWATDDVPVSMYRRPEDGPPFGWCQEACPWSDVHASIGAWGDDFSSGTLGDNWAGGVCKLPAQILLEGGTCTPCGPGGSGCN